MSPSDIADLAAKVKQWHAEQEDGEDREPRCVHCSERYRIEIGYEATPLCNACAHDVAEALLEAYQAQSIEVRKLKFGYCTKDETCGHCQIHRMTDDIERLEKELATSKALNAKAMCIYCRVVVQKEDILEHVKVCPERESTVAEHNMLCAFRELSL